MASVSSLGVGSGLGLSDILDSLKTAEKASLKPISTQQSANTAKLSAYGTLKSALTTFQTANTTLNNANLFGSSKVSSSSTAFSATTTSSAAAGKYTVSVTQLATAQTLTSGVKSDATTALATSDSTITIQQGGGKKPITVPVTAANSSLNGIRDAINKADPSVNASVIKVADGSYRLSLTASDTGSDNAMTLSVTGDSDLQSFIAYDGTASGNMTQSVAAQNAQLTVNNVAIESDSNTISDALDGVTLTLNDRTTGNQSLSVTKDTTSASSALSAWVDAYNTLQDSFSSLTKYTAVDTNADAQSSTNGALIGDSTLRTIQTQLKTMLTNSQSSSTYKSLSQIGITTDPKTGKLELDKEKLSTSLAKDPDGIKAMIIGDGKTTGVATKIGTNITGWLSSKGLVQTATDSVSKTLNSLTEQYNAASDRVDAMIARYKTQFTQLDLLVSKLNNTSSYLTNQFETSSNSNK